MIINQGICLCDLGFSSITIIIYEMIFMVLFYSQRPLTAILTDVRTAGFAATSLIKAFVYVISVTAV